MDEPLIIGGSGGPQRPRNVLALQTRAAWDIPNEVPDDTSHSMSRIHAEAAHELFAKRPTLRLRSLLGPYNCVGLVFGSRRTAMEPEHIRRILRDDGYRKIERAEAHLGDLVVYHTGDRSAPTHIGVVFAKPVAETDPSLTILSKWGHDPEYLHDLRDVPELFGHVHEFYTERRR
jgi:hypothetical protein